MELTENADKANSHGAIPLEEVKTDDKEMKNGGQNSGEPADKEKEKKEGFARKDQSVLQLKL